MPSGGAWLHADSFKGDLGGHWHQPSGGSATSRWRGCCPCSRPIFNSKSQAVVQRLPVFGKSSNSEHCGRVLRAGLEKREEAQEAESSPSAASTNTPTATAEGYGEPSHSHAYSRAGSKVETLAREAKGTQPQDPWTGEGPPQCLTYKPWLLIPKTETTLSSHSVTYPFSLL